MSGLFVLARKASDTKFATTKQSDAGEGNPLVGQEQSSESAAFIILMKGGGEKSSPQQIWKKGGYAYVEKF